MLSQWMVLCVAFLTSFVLTSFLFFKLPMFEAFRSRNFSATAAIILGSTISAAVILGFNWIDYDFIKDITLWTFLAPLIGLSIIFVACFVNKEYLVEATVIVASIVGVFGGNLFIEFIPAAPVFINKICSVVVWSLFSLGVRCVASLYPMLQIQGIIIAAGFVLLCLFGAVPFIIGVVAVVFLASMTVAYLNYTNHLLSVTVSPIIGYFIGWFGLVSYHEMLMPCFLILVMFCLLEMLVCFVRRLSFLEKYKIFSDNSIMIQVYKSGLTPVVIIKTVWVMSSVVLVFCIFQANGVNSYSIPGFVVLFIIWQLYRMLNWQDDGKSWKDTNKEAVKELKKTIGDIVNNVKDAKKSKKAGVKKTKTSKGKANKLKKGQK